MSRVFRWIAGGLVLGAFVILNSQERRRPLRRRVEPDVRHGTRNLVIAGFGALSVVLCEAPVIQPLTKLVQRRRWGLLGALRLPPLFEAALALLLMDYTFYVWHVLLHRAPLLWRFHAVHHVDRDLDTSTALRFHFGELIASIPWRSAQVALIGLTPRTFAMWQVWFALCVMFHHSNLRLPISWERRINRILVTPRMHGVHHSNRQEETDSNWSSGLTVWDWLHGTLQTGVPQQAIQIGVPAFESASSVELANAMWMPFRAQPEYWRFPDGTVTLPRSADRSDTPLEWPCE